MNGRTVRWLLAQVAPGRLRRGGASALTIVRHHRVYRAGERPLYRLGVTDEVLEQQVATLARAGLVPVTVAEGLARLAAGEPGRHVAFSFDDGYADNVRLAVPILARHGARGTFYLTAGLMQDRRAPWWDELAWILEHATRADAAVELGGTTLALRTDGEPARRRALADVLPLLRVPPAEQRARLARLREALGAAGEAPCELATWSEAAAFVEAGMEVGAHTMQHPFLSLLPAAEQRREIGDSCRLIAARLGVEPTGLAYPNGDHDDVTVEATRAAGLAYAVTTRSGTCHAGDPPYRLVRRGLSEGACLGPDGRFSAPLALAELGGAFDALRRRREEVAS